MSNQLSFFDPQPGGESLPEVAAQCQSCTRCALSQSRQKVVFGAGNPDANIMLIGQGPSRSDDQTGLPYSGPSGEVLDKALAEVGLSRDKIWLTNLHKCLAYDHARRKLRPPRQDEITACKPWLTLELALVKPKVLVCLGGPAAQVVIQAQFSLQNDRGKWFKSRLGTHQTLATFQPAYLMRLKNWDRAGALAGWQALVADLNAAVAAVRRG